MSKRDKLNGEIFRRKVRELIEADFTVRQIAAETGKKYVHVKQIYDQELADLTKLLTVPKPLTWSMISQSLPPVVRG